MPPIIVPNRNIPTYLKYEIARGSGIAAGLKFQVTEEFLNELLEKRDEKQASKLANGALMRAMFIDVLSDEADPARPLPEVVRTYIDAGGDDQDARDLRRFQLASRLARLARRYDDTRPGLTRAWADGQVTLAGEPLEGTEQWQRDLWDRVVEEPGGPQARARAERGGELDLASAVVRVPRPEWMRIARGGPPLWVLLSLARASGDDRASREKV